jgi:hypothetical protein
LVKRGQSNIEISTRRRPRSRARRRAAVHQPHRALGIRAPRLPRPRAPFQGHLRPVTPGAPHRATCRSRTHRSRTAARTVGPSAVARTRAFLRHCRRRVGRKLARGSPIKDLLPWPRRTGTPSHRLSRQWRHWGQSR